MTPRTQSAGQPPNDYHRSKSNDHFNRIDLLLMPNDDNFSSSHSRTWIDVVSSVATSSGAFVALAAREWLPSLVDQPTSPPFSFNALFKDEFQRVARLIAFVIVLSVLILGSMNLLIANFATFEVVKNALRVLAMALILAICYQPIAFISQIRVAASGKRPKKPLTLRQILFSVLFTFVPWIPIFTFLWATIPRVRGTFLILLLLAVWVSWCYSLYNFAKAIVVITRAPKYRVWISIISPLLVLSAFILFR